MLRVEYVHIALLLGWLQDAVTGVVMSIKEDEGNGGWTVERKVEVLRALGKLWWMQNDLFARQYCEDWDLEREEEKRRGWLERPMVRVAAVGAAGLRGQFLIYRKADALGAFEEHAECDLMETEKGIK